MLCSFQMWMHGISCVYMHTSHQNKRLISIKMCHVNSDPIRLVQIEISLRSRQVGNTDCWSDRGAYKQSILLVCHYCVGSYAMWQSLEREQNRSMWASRLWTEQPDSVALCLWAEEVLCYGVCSGGGFRPQSIQLLYVGELPDFRVS